MNSFPYVNVSQEILLGGNPLKTPPTHESNILKITTSFNFMHKARKN